MDTTFSYEMQMPHFRPPGSYDQLYIRQAQTEKVIRDDNENKVVRKSAGYFKVETDLWHLDSVFSAEDMTSTTQFNAWASSTPTEFGAFTMHFSIPRRLETPWMKQRRKAKTIQSFLRATRDLSRNWLEIAGGIDKDQEGAVAALLEEHRVNITDVRIAQVMPGAVSSGNLYRTMHRSAQRYVNNKQPHKNEPDTRRFARWNR